VIEIDCSIIDILENFSLVWCLEAFPKLRDMENVVELR
jgi:hypothetical protein